MFSFFVPCQCFLSRLKLPSHKLESNFECAKYHNANQSIVISKHKFGNNTKSHDEHWFDLKTIEWIFQSTFSRTFGNTQETSNAIFSSIYQSSSVQLDKENIEDHKSNRLTTKCETEKKVKTERRNFNDSWQWNHFVPQKRNTRQLFRIAHCLFSKIPRFETFWGDIGTKWNNKWIEQTSLSGKANEKFLCFVLINKSKFKPKTGDKCCEDINRRNEETFR